MGETENNKERIEAQLDLIEGLIKQEDSALLGVAGLAIALIVVLSLSRDLIAFNILEGKILLTSFLALIVVSMIIHLYTLNYAKVRGIQIIEKIINEDIRVDINFFEKVVSYSPRIVMAIFFVCIAYVVYVIWR